MNFAWMRPFAIRARHYAVKNAPHILMGMGTAGTISALISAINVTPAAINAKVSAAMDKGEDIRNGRREGTVRKNEDGSYALPKLTVGETIKACGKFYIAPVGLEVASLACFWGAHGIDIKRQAILAGLYSTAEATLQEYQKKVAEMIGEKAEKEVRTAIAEDHVYANPPPVNNFINTDTDCWCYYKGYRFRSNYVKLKDIQNDANKELIDNLYLSESDLLWMFDPDRRYIVPDDSARMIGWSVDRLMEFDILPTITPEHQPALTVNIRDKDGREYLPRPGYSASL